MVQYVSDLKVFYSPHTEVYRVFHVNLFVFEILARVAGGLLKQ